MKIEQKLRNYVGFNLQKVLVEDKIGLIQNCLNCKHFDEPKEVCTLFNNERPPARIIAFSCDKYEDIDEIPF